MDPLSALSVVGYVLQFTQFASGLIRSTRKIYRTGTGVSPEREDLAEISRRLLVLCANLGQTAGNSGDRLYSSTGFRSEEQLRQLAADCRVACQELICNIEKLAAKHERSRKQWWSSFKVAMLEVRRAKDMEELGTRIDNFSKDIVLHTCVLCKENSDRLNSQLQDLQLKNDRLYESRSRQLGDMKASLNRIEAEISAMRDRPQELIGVGDIDSLSQRLSALSLARKKLAHERALLDTLDYDHRPARHEAILPAHRKTFDWVFSQPCNKKDNDNNLSHWFRSQDSLFWISGRPGSGKSTLMKYIADDNRTQQAVSEWASPKKGVIASHYFWSAGTKVQKSQDGLLRSLLYDILQAVPDLIPLVCEERWMALEPESPFQGRDRKAWGIDELRGCLEILACQPEMESKFCFFIDGLDEYAGDHLEICQALLNLARSTQIKLCVSSRSWNVFQDSFGGDSTPKLFIHDLTRDDIRNYSEARLLEHPRCSQLPSSDRRIRDLVSDITERAHGVFLWVFFVTKLLRDGLTNDDSLPDLHRRLDIIPTDLGEFFRHILNSVDSFYHMKMAHTLRLALIASEPLDCVMYGLHELEYEDELYPVTQPVDPNEKLLETWAKPVPRQIEARSKGLLEVKGNYVQFLHRTVKDFLATREMADFLICKSSPKFEPNASIMKALIARMKRQEYTEQAQVISSLGVLCERANDAEVQGETSIIADALLDDVESSLDVILQRWTFDNNALDYYDGIGLANTADRATEIFRQHILMHFVTGYASRMLEKNSYSFHWDDLPALSIVIQPVVGEDQPSSWTFRQVQLLKYLLSNGHDPNLPDKSQPSNQYTPWTSLMGRICGKRMFPPVKDAEVPGESEHFSSALETNVTSLFLSFGADPNACIRLPDSKLPAWFAFFLATFLIRIPRRFHSIYLSTLQQIFIAADFTAMREKVPHSFALWDSYHISDITAWELLQKHFESLSVLKKQGTLDLQQLSLLSRALRLFVRMSQPASLSWADMERSLISVFPTELLRPILAAILCLQTGDVGIDQRKEALVGVKRGLAISNTTRDDEDGDDDDGPLFVESKRVKYL